tara:strand:- start:42 stop:1001 length:960 start_codon:yes stop_codon:yes gene_type:complete
MAESQTVITREAPEIEAYKLGLMEQAKSLAGTPPSAEQLAKLGPKQLGLSPIQQQLINEATGGIGDYQQYLTDADTRLDEATATLGRAETAGGLSTGIFDPNMVQQFMNPYQKAVTEQALDQLNKQFLEQSAQRSAGALGAGAFGGSRQGVLEGLAQRELGDVTSRRIFEDLARNFGQAQQSAMTAFENQQRRQANQASLLSNLSGQRAGQAMQQAGLGELAQNIDLKELQALGSIGQIEQAQRQADEQARLAAERFAFTEPQQRLSFYSDILRGVPSTQIQSLVGGGGPPQTPIFQQALGAGITGLGLYGAGNKLGIF